MATKRSFLGTKIWNHKFGSISSIEIILSHLGHLATKKDSKVGSYHMEKHGKMLVGITSKV